MNRYSINQFIPLFVIVIGVGLAVLMGRWIGSGSFMMPAMIIGGILGTGLFLFLGQRYWYMIPFALASELPAIPLGGRNIESGELFVAACTVIFVMRVAMKKDHVVFLRASHVPLLCCFAWICMVWVLNPTGFLFFGSDVMGARYYIKIILAFMAFLVMAGQQPTEKDFLRIIYLIFFGMILRTAYGFISYAYLGGENAAATLDDSGYTWQQVLAAPALVGTFYLFAKYKSSEIFGFQRPLLIFVYIVAIVIGMLSGKRMSLFLILLTPFLGAIVYREYRYLIVAALLAVVGAIVVILGQGQLFNLPFTAQRALSWLPAQWEPSLQEYGTNDLFRQQLRILAIDEIKEHPWIGEGYATTLSDVVAGLDVQQYGLGLELEKVMGHAVSKNWHNTWLGYSADFGIPFMILHASLLATVLILSFRLARGLPHPSTRQTFCIYAFFSVATKIVTIHTSGHTALDAFSYWWLYGLLFAVAAQVKQEKRKLRAERSVAEIQEISDRSSGPIKMDSPPRRRPL